MYKEAKKYYEEKRVVGDYLTKESVISMMTEFANEQVKAITVTRCSETLPDESEMMHKRHKEYHLAIKNVETIESGSFYSGFRRCWSWLKSYELVED